MVLEKVLKSPLDFKEIKPVNPKENQPWIFRVGRTDAEAPILWPRVAKSRLSGKDPDVGKDWRQKKRAAEDETVVWYDQINGLEFEQTLGDSGRERSLVSYSPWSHKQSDMTYGLKSNNNMSKKHSFPIILIQKWLKEYRWMTSYQRGYCSSFDLS